MGILPGDELTARIWGNKLTIRKELTRFMRILNYNKEPVTVKAQDEKWVVGPIPEETHDVLEALGADQGKIKVLKDQDNFIILEPFQEYNRPGMTFSCDRQLIFEISDIDHASVEPMYPFVEGIR